MNLLINVYTLVKTCKVDLCFLWWGGVLRTSIFMLIPQKNIILWNLVNTVCWVQVKWIPWKEGFKNPQKEAPIQWNCSHNSYIYSWVKLQSHHWYSIKIKRHCICICYLFIHKHLLVFAKYPCSNCEIIVVLMTRPPDV